MVKNSSYPINFSQSSCKGVIHDLTEQGYVLVNAERYWLYYTKVWQIYNNPAWNTGVDSAERFLFGKIHTPHRIVQSTKFTIDMVEDWGIRVFLTETEAKRAL